MGLVSLKEELPESSFSLLHVRKQRESGCLQARKQVLTRNQISWRLDFGFPRR